MNLDSRKRIAICVHLRFRVLIQIRGAQIHIPMIGILDHTEQKQLTFSLSLEQEVDLLADGVCCSVMFGFESVLSVK